MYQQYVSNSLQDWPPWCPDFGGCVAWQMVLVPPMINGIHEVFNNSRWIQGDTDTLLVNQHRLENATLFLKMYLLLKLQNVFWCHVSEDFVVSTYGSLNLTNRTAEVESMLFFKHPFFSPGLARWVGLHWTSREALWDAKSPINLSLRLIVWGCCFFPHGRRGTPVPLHYIFEPTIFNSPSFNAFAMEWTVGWISNVLIQLDEGAVYVGCYSLWRD